MELCAVDTVLSVAVSGGLCNLDRVSGGGNTDMRGVVTVVSGAVSGYLRDIDSVSRGDLVGRVGEMSLPGGGDAVVSGVDDSVCGVSSVLADGIIDLCGTDTVLSGVDETVCGVSSLMTAGELGVCGCDSLVSDGLVIRVVLRWLMTLLRVVMTHCCLTRFMLVAGCRRLD